MLRYVLLALLRDGHPRHGYALMKAYTARLGVSVSIGNIYRELQRLVSEGFITTAANPAGADPRRAPYIITKAGDVALAQWIRAPLQSSARGALDEIACRLAVLGDLDADSASVLLEELHDELWPQAKAVERERAAAGRSEGVGRAFPIHATLLTRRAMQLAADVELVNQLRQRVVEHRGRAPAKTAAGDAAPEDASARRTSRSKTARGDER